MPIRSTIESRIGNRQSELEYRSDSLTYTQLLRRNRSFRRLWIGQVISELGNWFNFIAALGLVRVVSNAAPEVTTIILIARLVPFTLFSPLAGAFVDRWSRRTVMIVTDLLRVVVALGFLLVRRPEDLWIAYLCTALLSFFGAFFEAAKECRGAKHHGRTRSARGQRVDVFIAVPVHVAGRSARWLDRGTRRLRSGVCHQRAFVSVRRRIPSGSFLKKRRANETG